MGSPRTRSRPGSLRHLRRLGRAQDPTFRRLRRDSWVVGPRLRRIRIRGRNWRIPAAKRRAESGETGDRGSDVVAGLVHRAYVLDDDTQSARAWLGPAGPRGSARVGEARAGVRKGVTFMQ